MTSPLEFPDSLSNDSDFVPVPLRVDPLTYGALRWPRPAYDPAIQPHLLFILTPPYAGSTALAQLLNTSHRTMILQRKGEGQWLLPGMREKDRWNPDKTIDYASVKAVWLHRYQMVNRLTGQIDVVIEKSPPNMMRIAALSELFDKVSFLAFNRDPYASCASRLHRYKKAAGLDTRQRCFVLSRYAKDWLLRSAKLMELVQQRDIPWVSYETFCSDPGAAIALVDLPARVTDSMDAAASVHVKDYPCQPVTDFNARQTGELSDNEIDTIGAVLKEQNEVLEYFGYRPL